MIKLGDDGVSSLYIGTDKIGKAYLGSDLVYQSGPGIPDGPVDWIKTDGVAYIDTGITGAQPKSFSLKATFTPGDNNFAGARKETGEGRFFPVASFGTDTSTIAMGYDYYWSIGDITPAVTNQIPLLVHSTFTTGSDGQLVTYKAETDDKFTRYTHGSTTNVSTGTTMGIFAIHRGSNWYKATPGCKLYYFRIYGDKYFSSILFDGVPYKYNGEYGLWDNVSNTFFGNAGASGKFRGGMNNYNYTPVEYIQTDGDSYIDTGILATGKISAEVKYLAVGGTDRNQMILGTSSGNEDTNLFGVFITYSDKLGLAYHYYYVSDGLDINTSLTNDTPFIARISYNSGNGAKYCYVKEEGESSFRNYSKSVNEIYVSYSMYLFAAHNPSGGVVNKCESGSRIYYCKIYADTTYTKLAFDGVPCYYNGEYGLWDRISNSFFGNANSSGTITGPSVSNS